MRSRRPGSGRARGVRLLAPACPAALALVALSSCGGPVTIASHDLGASDRAACEEFVADLPSSLAGQDRVDVQPDDALGAAYGDPAITVTCGVPVPADYDITSRCDEVNGVGWYIPNGADDDRALDLRVSVPGYRPIVEVVVPAEDRPADPTVGDDTTASALSTLSPIVAAHLHLVQPCTG